MSTPLRKSNPILSPVNQSLVDLPAPSNISTFWSFGSLLGVCLTAQLITGVLLAMHYSPHTDIAFSSITHIMRDVNFGWALRSLHANGASAFFLCLYAHIARGMYFGSQNLSGTWSVGVTMFIISMATAFMGYLLPWGQMSFWGATVITNLFSAFPYIGVELVEWLWGGFGVSNATLTRFFALHFILPFLIIMLVIIHLILLHSTGSSNPLGLSSNSLKIPFHIHFSTKDMVGFIMVFMVSALMSFFYPNILTDPENFIPANPLVTPTHIKPEWYFLWAYAILRSIPNKLGGVICMFTALLIYYFMPMLNTPQQSASFLPQTQMTLWLLLMASAMLTWIGGCPVEPPYDWVGMIMTFTYFYTFLLLIIRKYMTLYFSPHM